MPNCCLMVTAASPVLFRIKWRCINQIFYVQRIFKSHNSHVWPVANPHAASVHYHQQRFAVNIRAGTAHGFLIGPYMLPRWLRFTGCFWRKSYQKWWKKSCWHSGETCGSSTTGLRFTLHVRSENISSPLTMITGLDRDGLWLGLPGHQTSHQYTSSCVITLKPWLSRCQLILKRILLPVLLRQQQPSGRNLAYLSHINLCSVVVSCVSRVEVVRLNICSKLVRNTTFLQNTSVVLLISNLSQTHFDDPWHSKVACPTYSCLTVNLCSVPPHHLTKFGHGVFLHPVKWYIIYKIYA